LLTRIAQASEASAQQKIDMLITIGGDLKVSGDVSALQGVAPDQQQALANSAAQKVLELLNAAANGASNKSAPSLAGSK